MVIPTRPRGGTTGTGSRQPITRRGRSYKPPPPTSSVQAHVLWAAHWDLFIKTVPALKGLIYYTPVRGLVKLKKSKNPRKTQSSQTHAHPSFYPFFLFGNNWKHENNTKNTKNIQLPNKILNPSWGLTHPPTSDFFSIFFFFHLTKPLSTTHLYNIYTMLVQRRRR